MLAGRVPILKDAVRDELVTQAVSRSALIGLAGSRLGASRPLLTLEQVRLSSHLRTTTEEVTPSDDRTVLAGELAILLASGFGLRHAARAGRTVLPAPVVQAAVAASARGRSRRRCRRSSRTFRRRSGPSGSVRTGS